MGKQKVAITVELGYIAIRIAITRQIIIAVSVHVNAALETSCCPSITIAVGSYTKAKFAIATADILGKQKVAITVELGYIAIINAITG